MFNDRFSRTLYASNKSKSIWTNRNNSCSGPSQYLWECLGYRTWQWKNLCSKFQMKLIQVPKNLGWTYIYTPKYEPYFSLWEYKLKQEYISCIYESWWIANRFYSNKPCSNLWQSLFSNNDAIISNSRYARYMLESERYSFITENINSNMNE